MIPQFDKIEESRGPCNTYIGKVLNSWLPASPGCKALQHEETTQTHGCIPTIPVSLKLTELLCSVQSQVYSNFTETEDVTNHPYMSNSSMSLPCKTCLQFFKHVTKNFDRVFPFCLGTAEARHTRLPVNFR